MKRTFIVAMVVIFALLSIVFVMMDKYVPQYHTTALHVANVVMVALSLGAYLLVNRKIGERPHAFVQGVYSASLMKLMVCMGAMLAYVMINREKIHKPSVFALMGVYTVYSAIETILLSRTARTNKK